MELEAGTMFRLNGAGGGGYGDPSKRARAAIENDIAEGFVTLEAARRDYGYEPDS
jgi:N-methylhydantoinase B